MLLDQSRRALYVDRLQRIEIELKGLAPACLPNATGYNSEELLVLNEAYAVVLERAGECDDAHKEFLAVQLMCAYDIVRAREFKVTRNR